MPAIEVVPEVGLNAENYSNKNIILSIKLFDTKQNTKVFQRPISAMCQKAEQTFISFIEL
jgi:hypothetical protein